MDINSATWQVAVDAAGIWPSTIELELRRDLYVIAYHRDDAEDRILTTGGRTLFFSEVDSLNLFILGPHAGLPNDVHLALEVLSSLSPEGLAPELFPRYPLGRALSWIAGDGSMTSEQEAAHLLDTLIFLNEWHESLLEDGQTGTWPEDLDDAVEILSQVVETHRITTSEANTKLAIHRLQPVLTQEIARLLN